MHGYPLIGIYCLQHMDYLSLRPNHFHRYCTSYGYDHDHDETYFFFLFSIHLGALGALSLMELFTVAFSQVALFCDISQ